MRKNTRIRSRVNRRKRGGFDWDKIQADMINQIDNLKAAEKKRIRNSIIKTREDEIIRQEEEGLRVGGKLRSHKTRRRRTRRRKSRGRK